MALVRSESIKLIQQMLEEEFVPGISIALVDAHGPIWLEGFGTADARTGKPVTVDTVFRVGSLSKPITALSVMQLVAEEKISLDTPIQERLKAFSIRQHKSAATAVITPRQLLSHRSGLPSDLHKGMYTDTYFTDVTERLHQEYTAYSPETIYNYSNLGYDLLGHLVEQCTHEKFATYVNRALLKPLRMSDSGFVLTPSMRKQISSGHLDGQVKPLPPLRDTPALGFYSTAEDISRFMSSLLRKEIPGIPSSLLEQMWTQQTAKNQIPLEVIPGLGWFVHNNPPLGQHVRHGGSTLLFGAEMILLPKQSLGVAVFVNGAKGNRLARELATTLLTLAVNARGRYQLANRPNTEQNEYRYNTPSGGYATDLGLLMIDPERLRLCACLIEQILDLVRFDDGSLGLTQQSIHNLPKEHRILGDLRFRSRLLNDMDLLIAYRNGKEITLGNKIASVPWKIAWRQRLGHYRTINPDGNFSIQNLHLSEESGVLCLHYRAPHLSEKQIRVPLQPVSENEAIVQGFGRGGGETVQMIEINGKQCLKFSGFIGEPMDY
jgi:CubicO group peptidase (beta-lactamase class C family)